VILVIAEQRDGKLNRATWEAIAAAQQLAGGAPVAVAVLGGSIRGLAQELGTAAVAEVLVGEHGALEPYTPDAYAAAVIAAIEAAHPDLVVLPHTYQTRDFAPLLAARAGKPLITDVTGITGTGQEATFTRPMFQGKLAAQVKPQGAAPALVTVQIGAFRADAAKTGGQAEITKLDLNIDTAAIRQKPEAPFREAKQAVDLGQAERIVAVGRGIK
jgi:electron transfer flavoprotein alpha subunit